MQDLEFPGEVRWTSNTCVTMASTERPNPTVDGVEEIDPVASICHDDPSHGNGREVMLEVSEIRGCLVRARG